MTFIKEVTYIDDRHSHWVAPIAGRHEWDAVNVQNISVESPWQQAIRGAETEKQATPPDNQTLTLCSL